MKYNIFINQVELSKYKSLDIKDGAILNYLKDFCSADDKKIDQLDFNEEGINYRYTWIDYGHLIQELPLMRIKSTSLGAISQRIKKLEKIGFIKTKVIASEKFGGRKLYIRLTEKIKELEFKKEGLFTQKNDLIHTGERPYSHRKIKHNTKEHNTIEPSSIEQSSIELNKEIADSIFLFKEVNPSYEQLFKRSPQRKAMERLIKRHGIDKIKRVIKVLFKTNQLKYAPTITTPIQLEEKLGSLIAFIQKERNKGDSVVAI